MGWKIRSNSLPSFARSGKGRRVALSSPAAPPDFSASRVDSLGLAAPLIRAMDPLFEHHLQQTRRQFFGRMGLRAGSIALASMLGRDFAAGAPATAAVHPPLPGLPHFAPKAKRLIYLHMNGAPSQLDLWDHKPQLRAHYDKDLPESIRQGQRITTMTSGQARL